MRRDERRLAVGAGIRRPPSESDDIGFINHPKPGFTDSRAQVGRVVGGAGDSRPDPAAMPGPPGAPAGTTSNNNPPRTKLASAADGGAPRSRARLPSRQMIPPASCNKPWG